MSPGTGLQQPLGIIVFVRSKANRPGPGRSIRSLVLPLVGSQRGRLARMSIAAIVSGFAEAAILVLIARIAFALASTHNEVQVKAGPLGSHTFTIDQLVLLAGALVIVRIALQTVAVILETRVTTSVLEHQRNSLVRRYLAAGWALQSQQSDGRLQELVTTYAAHASGAVDACASGAIAAFNLFALLLTAIFVNAVASIAAAVAALMIGLLLRPLRAALRRRSSRAAIANLEFATGLTEMTSTLQEVRIFGVEPQIRARLDTLNRRSIERSLATGYVSGAIPIIYQGVAMLLMVGALGCSPRRRVLAARVSGSDHPDPVAVVELRDRRAVEPPGAAPDGAVHRGPDGREGTLRRVRRGPRR